MKYTLGILAGAFALTGMASADVCGQLETFAKAIETNTPGNLADYPELGAGESECMAMIGLESVGLGGHRMGVSTIACVWDNADANAPYTRDDVRHVAGDLHACPVLLFEVLDDYGDQIEYKFSYGNQTLFLLGNDESGMFLDVFRNE